MRKRKQEGIKVDKACFSRDDLYQFFLIATLKKHHKRSSVIDKFRNRGKI